MNTARHVSPADRHSNYARHQDHDRHRFRYRATKFVASIRKLLIAAAVIASIVARREFNARTEIEVKSNEVSMLLAGSYLDKGQALAERGDIGGGMLWMAYALQMLPPQEEDLRPAAEANLAAWYRQLHVHEMAFRHGAPVASVPISPDGRTVLSGGEDHAARLWNARTGAALGQPLVHPDKVTAVAFSGDGNLVLTGSADGKARIWHAGTGRMLGEPVVHGEVILRVEFSPDGRECITASRYGFSLWDLQKREPIVVQRVEKPTQIVVAEYTSKGARMAKANLEGAQLYRFCPTRHASAVRRTVARQAVKIAIARHPITFGRFGSRLDRRRGRMD